MSISINSKDEFDQKLIDAGDQLVVVDFYATWCNPCKMIAPKLEELAKEYVSSILVLKVDVDVCEEIATTYDITSMPTFLFIKNKEVIHRFSGADVNKLKQYIIENKKN